MGNERGVEKRDAKAIAGFARIAFTSLLILAFVAVALGATGYSVFLSLACLVPLLVGFLLAWFTYLRARSISRESLRLELERDKLRPVEILRGSVILTLDRPRHMRSLQVRVWGGERTKVTVNYGKSRTTYVQEFAWIDRDLDLVPEGLAASAVVQGGGDAPLPPGTYRYRFEASIPDNAVPSWSGYDARVFSFVRARAYFSRGLDATQDKDFIILHPFSDDEKKPNIFGIEKQKLLSGTQEIQVSLDSRSARQGGTISGRVSISLENPKKVRGVQVQLAEREWATAKGHRSTHVQIRSSHSIPVAGGYVGMLPFILPVPEDVRPSVRGSISNLGHLLRVKLDIKLGTDVFAEDTVVILSRAG